MVGQQDGNWSPIFIRFLFAVANQTGPADCSPVQRARPHLQVAPSQATAAAAARAGAKNKQTPEIMAEREGSQISRPLGAQIYRITM